MLQFAEGDGAGIGLRGGAGVQVRRNLRGEETNRLGAVHLDKAATIDQRAHIRDIKVCLHVVERIEVARGRGVGTSHPQGTSLHSSWIQKIINLLQLKPSRRYEKSVQSRANLCSQSLCTNRAQQGPPSCRERAEVMLSNVVMHFTHPPANFPCLFQAPQLRQCSGKGHTNMLCFGVHVVATHFHRYFHLPKTISHITRSIPSVDSGPIRGKPLQYYRFLTLIDRFKVRFDTGHVQDSTWWNLQKAWTARCRVTTK